jgi:predicted MFS family arabinose efflux permease
VTAGTAVRRLPGTVWLAGTVAFLGSCADTFVLFVVLWVAQPQGWSGVQIALVVLALRLPTLVAGLPAGRAVDRFGARPVVLVDMSARVVLLAALVLCANGGALPLVPVLVLGGLAGACGPATYAAVRWLVPRLVPDDLGGRANAVIAVSDQLPLLIGAALVGPALAVLSPATSLLVPIALLAAGGLLARRLPTRPGTEPSVPHNPSTVESRWRWPRRVVAIIALSTAYYLMYGPFETATPGLVRDRLNAGEAAYSLLWTVFGAGALLGLMAAPALAHRRAGFVNAGGALVWGLIMLPVALVTDLSATVALFAVGGLVWGPYTTVETHALQRWVNPSRHGVVFGLQRGVLATATPVGAAAGAIALEHAAAHLVLAVSAAACALAGLLALADTDLRTAR